MNDHESAVRTSSPDTKSEPPTARSALVEFFTMGRALAEAKRRLYAPKDPGYQEFELGLAALKDADQLGASPTGRDTALLLYRSAIRLLARAALLRRALGSDGMSAAELWAHACQLPSWPMPAEAAPGWLDDVVKNEQGELSVAKLSPSERERALLGVKALAERLAAPLERDAADARRLSWTRRFRVSACLLLVISLLGWFISKARAENNLALHRPVTISEQDPNFAVDPSQVVDGDRLNLGFHTGQHSKTTLTIDLGASKPLARVEVYNRADCCQERAIPLALQLSVDGHHYKTVARQKQVFQHWVAPLPPATSARFIRLLHEGGDFFHLSEVEAY